MKKMLLICVLVVGLVSAGLMVWGAVGDFYVIPVRQGAAITWSQKLPSAERFKLVLDGAAVLDRETGLVWEQSPDTTVVMNWDDAIRYCYNNDVGGRKGWRLATIEELASLVDPTRTSPALPDGHPFGTLLSTYYWSQTTVAGSSGDAFCTSFGNGGVVTEEKGRNNAMWCVRGGYGHDGHPQFTCDGPITYTVTSGTSPL